MLNRSVHPAGKSELVTHPLHCLAMSKVVHSMFTIIQKNFDSSDKFVGWEVMATCATLEHACAFAAELCNLAGVVRTLVLDDMGQVVCVES